MLRTLAFTTYNRPDYLRSTITSWNAVRNIESWNTTFYIEPSNIQDEIVDITLTLNSTVTIHQNTEKLGVLVNPWNALNTSFEAGADFVVLAEDDVLVSSDVLEYFEWASEEYETAQDVLCLNAFSNFGQGKANQITRTTNFSPLIWGVWKNRWETLLRDTWDKDYSSGNKDGSEAGWDWNINRIIQAHGLSVICPVQSRSSHIGLFGTHMTPDLFESSLGAEFEQARGKQRYNEI